MSTKVGVYPSHLLEKEQTVHPYYFGGWIMALSKRWLTHIEAWQSSNIKQSAYCRQHGLNSRTFSARLSDFRKSRGTSALALIPVQIQNATPSTERLVLQCRQGHRLELPPTVSAVWLAELLRCLA